ncbi:MAG: DNA polymerase III subunit delta' [Gammaproteobacteria bacterium]|nr:DNA polymerase III subunit delta' [Gammaproteobacteria bacterium]
MLVDKDIFPWLLEPWSRLLARRDALPHALLIHGRPGLGKTHLAVGFAKRLLCEAADSAEPACGSCLPCGWFEQANHPDFRLVQPDALAAEGNRESADGGDAAESGSRSKQIRIDQVRDLQEFLRVGSHRGGTRIALIRPAEAMNVATANALLKSLEEPPTGALMLLVSSDPQRLLPTVRSRCQAVSILAADARVAATWLQAQGVDAPEAALSFAGGAPLAALEQAEHGESRGILVEMLSTPGFDPVRGAEKLVGVPPPDLVTWLQKWVYDLMRVRSGGAPRYHPGESRQLAGLARRADPIRLTRLAGRIAEARTLTLHPLNPKLFLEDLLMHYRNLSGESDGR